MKEFSPEQKKEYQTVVLAALLHDIGKFLRRGKGKYDCSHQEASFKFIQEHANRLNNDALYDMDLLKLLVRHHHSKKQDTLKDSYIIKKSRQEKDRAWKIMMIIKRADSYSCAERDLNQQRRSGVALPEAPLDSIFSNVNLDIANPQKKHNNQYHVKSLNPLESFPEAIKALDKKEIPNLIDDFEKNIPDFSGINKFEFILNKWLNLLEYYSWAVPSDTRYEISDVSLYDHLRSSSAIAACLYIRHFDAIEKNKNFSRQDEFVLIGGDFSGIQDYIFDITNKGSGGASKRLRARSFFIFLFSEATIHKILHSFNLPLVCNLFSAGGKFLLLAPYCDEANKHLLGIKAEIEKEIYQTYFNQFSLLMSWKAVRGFKKEFKVYNFFELVDEMFHKLESAKVRKFESVLLDKKCDPINGETSAWNINAFKADKMYSQYTADTGDCKICGKGPANCPDKDRETGEIVRCCPICYQDKYTIGQKLPKSNFIAFGKGILADKENGKKIIIFDNRTAGDNADNNEIKKDSYYVELLKDYKDSNDYYLIYDISGNKEKRIQKGGILSVQKYLANHVPIENKQNEPHENDNTQQVLSFEQIAQYSIRQKDNVKKGSPLLGILKADIDNLGLIFSKGFENPLRSKLNGKALKNTDKKTVSRFLTMSRMIDLFFSGWIKKMMSENHKNEVISKLKEIEAIDDTVQSSPIDKDKLQDYLNGQEINFNNIYTVYSGGDDLVLIGPWETMIVFSILLNLEFRRYTCNNEFITLSAGLTFIKPKHPIASGIKQADTLLNESKEKGKNMITLFGTTIEWKRLPELINFFLFLDNKLNDADSKINSAFLYRLLEYHRMALSYFDENKRNILGLKYISALSYDMGRNIVEFDKKGKITKGHEEEKCFHALVNEAPNKDSLMNNIKIPLFWALYRNRKAGRDENFSNF